MFKRPAWMDSKPPAGYIPGIGRGAVGFTTRSDIGPAKGEGGIEAPEKEDKYSGRKRSHQELEGKKEGGDDEGQFNDANYDPETGYSGSLFSNGAFTAEDEEADKIYSLIDDRMDERRKKRRETKLAETQARLEKERPKISLQFKDLKKKLATVTDEEWMAIPDIGDTQKTAPAREIYTPAPDSLLKQAQLETQSLRSIDPNLRAQLQSSGTASSTGTLTQMGAARNQMLDARLKTMGDSVSGQTVVDPQSYMSGLSSIPISTNAELTDQKKAQQLLKSVITTNPSHAPGWIAAARLEEVAGSTIEARKLIRKGLAHCPKAEDVWLEAVRLHALEDAKALCAKAIAHIPNSVAIWAKAAELESETEKKKKVLRKSLEFIPNSVQLWKSAIELEEEEENARIMLRRAVECLPLATEMWLALAKLEDYTVAQSVLNRARANIPTDHRVWIAAAQLEEREGGSEQRIKHIIHLAVESMAKYDVVIDRETWIREAEASEGESCISVCGAIISRTLDQGVDERDQRSTWMDDAQASLSRGRIETARAIYRHSLAKFQDRPSLWDAAISLEREHGSRESLEALLTSAVENCPHVEVFWLMGAKERWMAGDLEGARKVLGLSFKANPNSEEIWLAATKLEFESNEPDRARKLLARAREKANTQRVWMKSAWLERELGSPQTALKLLEQALQKFPSFDKLWVMAGQVLQSLGSIPEARSKYSAGRKLCPASERLWKVSVQLELAAGAFPRARSLVDAARLKLPASEEIWLIAIQVEERAGTEVSIASLLARALQACPKSGKIWAETIRLEPRAKRRAKAIDAVKKCNNDAHVMLAVARVFWSNRSTEKARVWFDRAVSQDSSIGDAWAYFLAFELALGSSERATTIRERAVKADPKYGPEWTKVRKAVGAAKLSTLDVLNQVASSLSSMN